MKRGSLARRVTAMVLGLLAVTLVALAVFIHTVLGARLRADLQGRLTDRAQIARGLDAQLSGQALADRLSTGDIHVTIGTGAKAIRGRPTPGEPPRPAPDPADKPGRVKPAPGTVGPVVSHDDLLTITDQLPHAGTVTLQVSSAPITGLLHRLLVYEALGSLLVLLLAGAACGGLVRIALRPLDRMTEVARASARGQRGARLNPVRPDTELGRTATAFDAMLDGLELSAAQAGAAEHQLRRFLADVSHELRTPIAALQATAETLLREEGGDREQLTVAAVRAARRAGRLVDDLLLMARADEGTTLPLQRERVGLASLVDESVQRARFLSPDLAIGIDVSERAAFWGDAGRLSQVLDNLLDNARAATPPGGSVTVTVDDLGPESLSIRVSDSGTGVPPADVDRIFERFTRLDPDHYPGSGLGLPLARLLARAHGGDLTYEHGPVGATFVVSLPRVVAAGRPELARA